MAGYLPGSWTSLAWQPAHHLSPGLPWLSKHTAPASRLTVLLCGDSAYSANNIRLIWYYDYAEPIWILLYFTHAQFLYIKFVWLWSLWYKTKKCTLRDKYLIQSRMNIFVFYIYCIDTILICINSLSTFYGCKTKCTCGINIWCDRDDSSICFWIIEVFRGILYSMPYISLYMRKWLLHFMLLVKVYSLCNETMKFNKFNF